MASRSKPEYATGTILDLQGNKPSFTVTAQANPGGRAEGLPHTFHITKTGTAVGPVSVTFSTADGSARAGEDYVPVERVITFEKNETRKSVTVETIDDMLYEGGERIGARLFDPTNGAVIADGAVETWIWDSADLPIMKISSIGSRDFNTFNATLGHSVWLQGETALTARATYTVCHTGNAKGSTALEVCKPFADKVTADAADFADGTQFSGQFIIAADGSGDTSADSINISMKSDTLHDGDEIYVVVLHNDDSLKRARIDTDERYYAFGILRDDDDPVGSIYNVWGSAVEAGTDMDFTIRRWGSTSGERTLKFEIDTQLSSFTVPSGIGVATNAKPAVAGQDYHIPNSDQVVFGDGIDEKTVSVQTEVRSGLPYRG